MNMLFYNIFLLILNSSFLKIFSHICLNYDTLRGKKIFFCPKICIDFILNFYIQSYTIPSVRKRLIYVK